MTHGFNPDLTCEGIIGDGCGGGRLFTIEDNMLKACDPQTKETIVLLEGVKKATCISKKACIITITCRDETIEFDLSLMKQI
jgi:hypothetical protein